MARERASARSGAQTSSSIQIGLVQARRPAASIAATRNDLSAPPCRPGRALDPGDDRKARRVTCADRRARAKSRQQRHRMDRRAFDRRPRSGRRGRRAGADPGSNRNGPPSAPAAPRGRGFPPCTSTKPPKASRSRWWKWRRDGERRQPPPFVGQADRADRSRRRGRSRPRSRGCRSRRRGRRRARARPRGVSCDQAGWAMATKAPAARARAAQLRAGLARRRRREIERQAGGEDVPEFADLSCPSMQFAADRVVKSWSASAAIGDRQAETIEKMLGELEEIVTGALVGRDDRLWTRRAVGQARVRVQIAAPEAAGARERGNAHQGRTALRRWRDRRRRA